MHLFALVGAVKLTVAPEDVINVGAALTVTGLTQFAVAPGCGVKVNVVPEVIVATGAVLVNSIVSVFTLPRTASAQVKQVVPAGIFFNVRFSIVVPIAPAATPFLIPT